MEVLVMGPTGDHRLFLVPKGQVSLWLVLDSGHVWSLG